MAKLKFFIAGTDVGVGKTLVTLAILEAANKRGLSTVGMKPVATGCRATEEGCQSDDVVLLMEQMSLSLPYNQINPIALEPALMPHIAAERTGRRILASQLVGFCRGVLMQSADLAIIEGSGGWRELLNARETMAGVPRELRMPVILVVTTNRGCINQTMLTVEAIARDGVTLAGWVANDLLGDAEAHKDLVVTLRSLIPAPFLGSIPFLEFPTAQAAVSHLDIDSVITG